MASLEEVPRKVQPATLNGLAAEISELSAQFTKFLEENNVPAPTFDADSPTQYDNLTPEIFMIRQHLLDKINDIWCLTQGPSESIFNYVHSAIPDAAVLNILNCFDFWSAVPLNGTSSPAEIARHTGLPSEVVERVLDHATTLRLFAYTE
ncbi:sterigmatocystin 8-O-methyltransferase, partial [Magnaporthiopsis poae ATCC 64411]